MGAPDDAVLARDLAVINEMTAAVTSTLDLAEIVRTALSRIKMLASAEAISLLRYDAERDELVFAATETLRESTFDDPVARFAGGLASWVARTGTPARVSDPAADPRCAGAAGLADRHARYLLDVPVRHEGRVVGVLELADRFDGRPFDAADEAALLRVAATLAARCDPERLPHDPVALRAVLAEVSAAVPSQAASLLLIDPSGRGLAFSASRRLEPGAVDGLRMPAGSGIAGWVARHRTPLLLDDASADPRWHRAIGAHTAFRPRAMLCVPLVSKDVLLGVIQVMNRVDGRPFDQRQLRLAQILADHTAIAMENARLFRQVAEAAVTDDLTGLGNARRLNRVLPQLVAEGRPLALLLLDFDHFKDVVDRYGHPIGSQVLAFLGKLMAAQLRPGDIATRFGGDEFAFILPEGDQPTGMAVAERIRAVVAAARRLDEGDVDISCVTASIGVAVYPQHAGDAVGLLQAADQAMFAIKRATKNAVGVAGA
jgi:diguanylate cyclase (GGDEF)-like protein